MRTFVPRGTRTDYAHVQVIKMLHGLINVFDLHS